MIGITNSILIVEDDPVISQLISWRLQKLGYRVRGMAQNADEALRLVDEEKPDLLLIDIMLQGEKDGTELARIVKSRFALPFIYLTAHSDNETLSRVLETGPSGFLLKPFKDEELRVAIELALNRGKGG